MRIKCMEDLKKLEKRCALHNAVRHEGTAQAGSVLGKILAAEPALRAEVKRLREIVDEAVREVNSMGKPEQEKLLSAEKTPAVKKQSRPDVMVNERSKDAKEFSQRQSASKGGL